MNGGHPEGATQDEALAAARRQRRWLLGALAVVAAAFVAIGIALSHSGGGAGTTTGPPQSRAKVVSLYAGIPQSGTALGNPRAKVTLAEYADLQCPYCGEDARGVLPEIVRRYVRTGRVRLVFRTLTFLGPDSLKGARMAGAAALQGRLWQFVDLVYHNQGEENTGWVTDAYLRRIAAAAGLDVRRAFAERGSPAVSDQLISARSSAKAAGVDSTPTFTIEWGGRVRETIDSPAGADGLSGPLDRALVAAAASARLPRAP
jgi:protein-disulfide isomerase